jgi:hypothetical protein
VWQAKVPQKLRVFAWKAATSSLSVCAGLHHRMSKVDPMCTICGAAVEDEHHALITCTLARALRNGMRDYWTLPPEEAFLCKGTEWLLSLLNRSHQDSRAQIIFPLWIVWHHRNNIVHGDGKASVAASIPYLRNYFDSFTDASHAISDPRGKLPVSNDNATISADSLTTCRWIAR